MFYEPLPARWRVFFGSPEFLDFRTSKYPKNTRKYVSGENYNEIENKIEDSVTVWQGLIEHVRAKLQALYLIKNGVDIGCLTNLG